MAGAVTTLLLPGIGNSGPEHWQSRWLALHPDFHRVLQDDWDRPDLDAWCRNLEAAVPPRARIGLAGVVFLEFRSTSNG